MMKREYNLAKEYYNKALKVPVNYLQFFIIEYVKALDMILASKVILEKTKIK